MRLVLATAGLLAMPLSARAGAIGVRCLNPFVFSGAAVNVLLLPYEYAGDAKKVTATGAKLSALAQLDTLFSIVKYGSVGVVQLATYTPAESRQCTADVVADKVLGRQPGAAAQLVSGHSAVLVWGRFFEDMGQTYIQTYVRFIARGASVDSVSIPIADHRFTGRLSSTSFSFAPRLVTVSELDDIQRRASEALRVYDQPDRASKSTHLDATGSKPLIYSVTDVKGNWMRIEGRQTNVNGWVPGDTAVDEWSLRRKLPEYIFVEGIVGYLRARNAEVALDRRGWQAAANALDRTLGEFVQAKGAIRSPAPLALAVGEQMLGVLQLLSQGATQAQQESARSAFESAVELVPYSADAVNLHLMTRLLVDIKAGPPVSNASAYLQGWTDALGRDPANTDALDNLQTFLEWLAADAERSTRTFAGGPAADIIRARLELTRKIKLARPGGS